MPSRGIGRGVLADVSGNLIAQFARSLEAELLGGSTPTATPSENGSAAPRLAAVPQADAGDSVDLLKVVALPVAKRFGPVLAAAAAAGVVGFLLGRRRNRRANPGTLLAEDLQAALARLLS